jgi:hypothetical protein
VTPSHGMLSQEVPGRVTPSHGMLSQVTLSHAVLSHAVPGWAMPGRLAGRCHGLSRSEPGLAGPSATSSRLRSGRRSAGPAP